MALNAKAVLEMLPDLERYLAIKASEELDGSMGGEEEEEDDDESPTPPMGAAPEAKGPGMGVVIALKPKGMGEGGKVPGCPDCADGTPHQHAK